MQRLITHEELQFAKQMESAVWAAPIVTTVACVGAGYGSLSGNAFVTPIFVVFALAAVTLWALAIRKNREFAADIEARTVEVLEGAPERVWMAGRSGPSYLRLSGQTIRIPTDEYQSVKEAYMVKVTFLPKSRIAVRVQAERSIAV
jgi:hypothetical protein